MTEETELKEGIAQEGPEKEKSLVALEENLLVTMEDIRQKVMLIDARIDKLNITLNLVFEGPLGVIGTLLKKEHFHAALEVFDTVMKEANRPYEEIKKLQEELLLLKEAAFGAIAANQARMKAK